MKYYYVFLFTVALSMGLYVASFMNTGWMYTLGLSQYQPPSVPEYNPDPSLGVFGDFIWGWKMITTYLTWPIHYIPELLNMLNFVPSPWPQIIISVVLLLFFIMAVQWISKNVFTGGA
ncbi:MAG: hypothetical protein J7K23_04210 [Thermoproteales archaeon]|nr:hypothetical protein [Thermoproteales archaeon]